MATLSEYDRDTISRYPLGGSLDYLRKSLQDAEESYASISNPYSNITNDSEGRKKAISRLLSALMGTEVALDLRLKASGPNIVSELAVLVQHVQSGDFNYSYYRPLVELVLRKASDSEIWSAVLDLISPQEPTKGPKILPQTQYLSITNANVKIIHKKILEFNQQLIEGGSKGLSLNPSDLDVLAAIVRQLEQTSSSPTDAMEPAGIDIVLKIATAWPRDKRLPGLDLLRLLAAASATVVTHTRSESTNILDKLTSSGVLEPSAPANNTMLAVRVLVNLFATPEGRLLLDAAFDLIHFALEPHLAAPAVAQNRNLAVAIATLYVNYAVMLRPPDLDDSNSVMRVFLLGEDLAKMLGVIRDAEALYRGLVALGTVLTVGRQVANGSPTIVWGVQSVLERVEGVFKEPRIRNVVKEIWGLL